MWGLIWKIIEAMMAGFDLYEILRGIWEKYIDEEENNMPGGGSSSFGMPGMGFIGPPVPPLYKKRRRRARLTQGDITELLNIKNILGRTAAANALPYYLGRGRG